MKKIKIILKYKGVAGTNYGLPANYPPCYVSDKEDIHNICDSANSNHYRKTGTNDIFYCVEDFIVNNLKFSDDIDLTINPESVPDNISDVFAIISSSTDIYNEKSILLGFVDSEESAKNFISAKKQKYPTENEQPYFECSCIKYRINDYASIYNQLF